MSLLRAALLPLVVLACSSALGAVTTTVVDLPRGGGVTQRFLYLHPDSPSVNVVFLPGGDGTLQIQNDGTIGTLAAQCNPVIRNQQAFADHGYSLALVGEDSTGLVYDFNNAQAVVQYLQAHDNVPTWIIGASAATAPSVNIAASLPAQSPLGLVLFSPTTITVSLGSQLKRITLILFNPLDTGQSAGQVYAALTSTPTKQLISIAGGNANGCAGNGYHLFAGLDAPFVSAITGFIDQYTGSLGAAAAANYQGLWWASPAMSESGWGINFAHQADTIFASWFTYDLTGKGLWLVMTAPKTAPGVYAGTLYSTTGPAFNAVPFNPGNVVATAVGNGTLTFTDANDGSFAYTVNGVSQMKAITREVFGTLPTCATATGSLAAASNYTDLWWASPAGVEAGWGINLNQEGSTIFATWFTYALNGSPMWLVVTAPQTSPGVYAGTLYQTTGPAFNALPFNPANVVATAVGNAMFSFSDGNNATFAYTVNGVSQVKAITREVFAPPGTACQ